MNHYNRISLVLVAGLFLMRDMAYAKSIQEMHATDSSAIANESSKDPNEIFDEMKLKVKVFSQDSSVVKRRAANHRFVQEMVRLVKTGKSWDMPWAELAPVSILITPDLKWRIMSWSVQLEQNSRRHYGCVWGQKGNFFPLIDQMANRFENDEVFDNRQWPGAVYYQLLPVTADQNNKVCYALVGYDAREPFSQRKVLEWLCPDPAQNMVQVGAPLIDYEGRSLCRWQLSYPRDVQVQLQWDKDRSLVYFDHLISRGSDPSSESFDYIPDGSFDGLVWGKERFVFEEMPNYQPLR
jgi:hypothetical protein